MNKATFFGAFLFVAFHVTGQQTVATASVDVTAIDNQAWNTYINHPDFAVEYRLGHCDPNIGFNHEAIYLRFTNLSTTTLLLKWHADQVYGTNCVTCDGSDEYNFQVVLNPGEILETDCTPQYDPRARIFARFTDANYTGGASPLTSFQLSNFVLTNFNE